MNAQQIKATVTSLGFEIVGSDLRRGMLQIRRAGEVAVKLLFVSRTDMVELMVREIQDGFKYGRDLTYVQGSRFYIAR